jgi:hypothetical protein
MIYLKRSLFVIFCMIYYPIYYMISSMLFLILLIPSFIVCYIITGSSDNGPQYITDLLNDLDAFIIDRIKFKLKL